MSYTLKQKNWGDALSNVAPVLNCGHYLLITVTRGRLSRGFRGSGQILPKPARIHPGHTTGRAISWMSPWSELIGLTSPHDTTMHLVG